MYILCLETSGLSCSVAVSNKEELLAEKSLMSGKFTHAESLHVFIGEVLEEAQISPSQIDAISVSAGPGSYTGLRIGISAAKGLCYALDKPLISVPTLQILARQIKEEGYVIPMLDARRMEVYSAVFDPKREQVSPTQANILDELSYRQWLDSQRVFFIGDGSDKFSKICNHPNAVFISGGYPQAKDMIKYSFEKYKQGQFEDIAYFEPVYLK